ncbi:hypothetical protein GOP47_0021223 [Adiantum capillus-veneris]|uniref:Uncharacterized protein n=1 Tax=Adiantum capillus-veneris TaxID=13818 RepID=A0A9D4Z6W6_ADICA|nr:hypothetical protein GOP47_0021223 [Adiantum capillus-veneris]
MDKYQGKILGQNLHNDVASSSANLQVPFIICGPESLSLGRLLCNAFSHNNPSFSFSDTPWIICSWRHLLPTFIPYGTTFIILKPAIPQYGCFPSSLKENIGRVHPPVKHASSTIPLHL